MEKILSILQSSNHVADNKNAIMSPSFHHTHHRSDSHGSKLASIASLLQPNANRGILGKNAQRKGDIMRIGINPWVDITFKYLFGNQANKELLLALVNAVLEEAGDKPVVALELLNPHNQKRAVKDKLSIVDIKAQNEHGEWFIIEVQVQVYGYFLKRLLYYWARHYQSQLKESEKYDQLKKVAVICFAVENLPLETLDYYNCFRLQEIHHHTPFNDDLTIHTIELPKFLLPLQKIAKPLERWTYFLKHGESLDDKKIPKQLEEPTMTKAIKELKVFSLDDHRREAYEQRLKAMRDYESSMAAEFQKGEQSGIQKTVANALKMGLDVETTHKLTGVSKEEIRKLQKSAKNK